MAKSFSSAWLDELLDEAAGVFTLNPDALEFKPSWPWERVMDDDDETDRDNDENLADIEEILQLLAREDQARLVARDALVFTLNPDALEFKPSWPWERVMDDDVETDRDIEEINEIFANIDEIDKNIATLKTDELLYEAAGVFTLNPDALEFKPASMCEYGRSLFQQFARLA